MRYSNSPGADFGAKLLPKIIHAVTQGVIATKTGLTDHELKVRINSGQELIDRMGHEGADLYSGLMAKVLSQENLAPVLRDFLAKAASGDNQWQAAGEFIFSGAGISGAFGSVLDNALAPTIRELNRLSPNLALPPDVIVRAIATGLYDAGSSESTMEGYGYIPDVTQTWTELSQTWPDAATVASMVNRGIINQQTANTIYRRLGFETDLITPLVDMQQSVLSIADAALAVLRGDIDLASGRRIAQDNGYSADDFNTFLLNTGEPPGAQELQQALRRGFIDTATFRKGILQSRVRDEWIDTLLALRYSPLNTADAVNAYVEGYLPEADVKSIADQNGLEPDAYKTLILAAGDPLAPQEMLRLWRYGLATEDQVKAALQQGRLKDSYIDLALKLKTQPMSVPDAIETAVQGYQTVDQAKAIALMNGLREEDFEPLYLTAGDPLPKEEMLRLYNRGVVTKTQVEDALRQSRLKDSYIDTALALAIQLPALYEVRTLLGDGSLTAPEATQILLEQGYQPSIVKSIVDGATGVGTQASKQLTLSMYTGLYQEGAISGQDFLTEIQDLGYSQASAELIQAEIDFKVTTSARTSALNKVKAAYVSGKFTEAQAQSDLNQLEIQADAVDKLIADWDIEKSTNIKLLSASQVVDAWFMSLFNGNDAADNTQQALTYLGSLGYDGPDSIILLEIKQKGPLDGSTAQQPGSTAPSAAKTSGSSGAT